MSSSSKLPAAYVPALFAVVALAAASRLLFLAEIPRGLYVDEANIGYNAALVAETGRDEHGEKTPLFFKAFGDARKPALVYMAAATIKLLGPSPFSLRLASVIFFFVFLAAFWLLARRLSASRAVRLYALGAAAFLPWLFRPSRYAIEIAAHPCAVMIALYFFHRAYAPPPAETRRKRVYLDAALAGLFLAGSLYTYEAATVLAFASLAAVPLVYRRGFFARHAALAAGFAAASAPWFWYALSHPGSMTTRFRHITYWYGDAAPVEKIRLFAETYAGYLSPQYLFVWGEVYKGKPAAGESHGVLFVLVFALALAGAVRFFRQGGFRSDRFSAFLFVNFWVTPVVGAISRAGHFSLMRGALMAIYFLVFSMHGFAWLVEAAGPRRRSIAAAAVLIALAAHAAFYMRYYFVTYPPQSVKAFGSWDFQTALQKAVDERPRRVIVSNESHEPGALRNFYAKVIDNPHGVPVETGAAEPEAGACLVYFARSRARVESAAMPYKQLEVPEGVVSARCYDGPA